MRLASGAMSRHWARGARLLLLLQLVLWATTATPAQARFIAKRETAQAQVGDIGVHASTTDPDIVRRSSESASGSDKATTATASHSSLVEAQSEQTTTATTSHSSLVEAQSEQTTTATTTTTTTRAAEMPVQLPALAVNSSRVSFNLTDDEPLASTTEATTESRQPFNMEHVEQRSLNSTSSLTVAQATQVNPQLNSSLENLNHVSAEARQEIELTVTTEAVPKQESVTTEIPNVNNQEQLESQQEQLSKPQLELTTAATTRAATATTTEATTTTAAAQASTRRGEDHGRAMQFASSTESFVALSAVTPMKLRPLPMTTRTTTSAPQLLAALLHAGVTVTPSASHENVIEEEQLQPQHEKRAKFISDNSTNAQQLTLPNAAEVWSLAAMKMVPTTTTTSTTTTITTTTTTTTTSIPPTELANEIELQQQNQTEQHKEKNLLDWQQIMLMQTSQENRTELTVSTTLDATEAATQATTLKLDTTSGESEMEIAASSTATGGPATESTENETATVVRGDGATVTEQLPTTELTAVTMQLRGATNGKADVIPTETATVQPLLTELSPKAEAEISNVTVHAASTELEKLSLRPNLTANTITTVGINESTVSVAATVVTESTVTVRPALPELEAGATVVAATTTTTTSTTTSETQTAATSTPAAPQTAVPASPTTTTTTTSKTAEAAAAATTALPSALNDTRNASELAMKATAHKNNENNDKSNNVDSNSNSDGDGDVIVSVSTTESQPITVSLRTAVELSTTSTPRTLTLTSTPTTTPSTLLEEQLATTTTSLATPTPTPTATATDVIQISNEVNLDAITVKNVTNDNKNRLIENSEGKNDNSRAEAAQAINNSSAEIPVHQINNNSGTSATTITPLLADAKAKSNLNEHETLLETNNIGDTVATAPATTKSTTTVSSLSVHPQTVTPAVTTETVAVIALETTVAPATAVTVRVYHVDVDNEDYRQQIEHESVTEQQLLDQTKMANTTTKTTTSRSTETTPITTTTTEEPYISLLDDSTTTASISPTTTTTTTAATTTTEAVAAATTGEPDYNSSTERDININSHNNSMLPTVDNSSTTSGTPMMLPPQSPVDISHNIQQPHGSTGTDVNVIIAITVSVIGVVALILLVAFLYLMRKRQKQMSYGQRCRPVSLDAYSLDNVSVLGSVRRKGRDLRASKRTYGNAAFDDPSLRHNLLSATELGKFLERRSSIFEEFRDVPQIIARADEVPAGCEDKNRYANVIPLPETRVVLQRQGDDDKTEYINANYVRGPRDAPNYYIACQAPLESTIADFWRMIWEQQSRVIIQATDLSENGIERCAEYLPPSVTLDNHSSYGDYQVTLKHREVKDKYAISTLMLKRVDGSECRELTHYWYKWPEVGVPLEEAPIIAMLLEARSSLKSYAMEQANELKHEKSSTLTLKSLEGQTQKADEAQGEACSTSSTASNEINGNVANRISRSQQGPLTVHCSPGTGRTGTIIACDLAIRSLETPKRSVDIPQLVYYVRRGRASAVQTKEQYEFIYKVANMYATKITNLSNDN